LEADFKLGARFRQPADRSTWVMALESRLVGPLSIGPPGVSSSNTPIARMKSLDPSHMVVGKSISVLVLSVGAKSALTRMNGTGMTLSPQQIS
jgi:hypothetical protein